MITSLVNSVVILLPSIILALIAIPMMLDIDSVQVPRLLFTTVEMLIIASLLIIITFRETVDLVAGEILADFETLHTRMLEVDQVAGHLVELLMDLGTVIDMEEGKAFMAETIPMCALGREIGCVPMHYAVI